MRVDVAQQYILGLDGAKSIGVAGIGGSCCFCGGELGAHVAGQVGVGGLPGSRVGILVDEVTQLGDDLPNPFS